MKQKIVLYATIIGAACFIIGGCFAFTGCATNSQQTALNTITTLEAGVTSAYNAYVDLTISGQASTNNLPRISKAYDTFQASAKLATDAIQYNTNGVNYAALVIEAGDLYNLINAAKKH